MRRPLAFLAAAFFALSPAVSAQTSVGSHYLPDVAGDLVDAMGNAVAVGTCLSLSGGTLTGTCSGSAGSAVRAAQYEVQTPGSAPLTTTPYYLTTYAELPGTINYARVAMLAASGANFQYVVHIVHAGTDTVVGGLNNNGVCDGESGCGASQLGTYASPNVVQATSANTYAVGDMIYVSFNTVGGTFIDVSFHLSVTM